ncbi:MAG: beta-galactosidase, partial [Sedimentisphaerales bacterium]|nr:beta-galactosidase [Sedimentisphaerales bacterium]
MKKSIKRIMLWAAAGTAILTQVGYCNSGGQITVYPAEITDVLHNPDMGWCLYTHGPIHREEPLIETVTKYPMEIADPLVNPDCGWGIWVGPDVSDGNTSYNVENLTTGFGDDVPLFSFVCIDWYWKDLEPQEGVFYWDDLDTVVNYWKARGKQINMRLWTTYDFGWGGQGGSRSAPDWLFDEAGCKHFNVEIPKGASSNKTTIRAPDYTDPIYLTKFGNFLKAARDHYEPEPSFYFIGWQAASYGPWGEWHESFGQYHWPSDEVQHETCVKMQNVYEGIFGSKCQMSIHGICKYGKPLDKSYETWKYQVAMEEAAAKGWVLGRHSCLYPTKENLWNLLKIRFFDEHRPSNALYGESSPAVYGGMARGEGGGLDVNLDGAIKMHYNWVHQYMTAYSYKKYPNIAYFERGLKAGGLGYRFALTSATYNKQVSAGSIFRLNQTWLNRNVGRAYRVYPL